MGKAISVTLAHKTSGKEINFNSLTKASDFLGINSGILSRILKGSCANNTEYFITSNQ